MYFKALKFKDLEMSRKILEEPSAPKCKEYGRKVKNFDEEVWKNSREKAMILALKCKFGQNKSKPLRPIKFGGLE